MHRPGTLTLVVRNTVGRAQDLYRELQGATGGGTKRAAKAGTTPELLLLHSRFRRGDREWAHERLTTADAVLRDRPVAGVDPSRAAHLRENGMICVATQVLEAGVDVSAETLITEVAPWANMVQRFGRCNRFGRQPDARIYWVDLTKKDDLLPYETSDLKDSRQRLARLPGADAAPRNIDTLGAPTAGPHARVIRRHDFLGLFATEPDLSGGFTDVSPFVRDLERESDVFVSWRDFKKSPPLTRLEGDELCRAPLGGVRDLAERAAVWEWNGELGAWERRSGRDLRPGMTLLLECRAGGYNARMGWTGAPEDIPEPVPLRGDRERDSQRADGLSETRWVPLVEHLERVSASVPRLAGLTAAERCAVELAMRWHDIGKAHEKWQQAIRAAGLEPPCPGLWAKFPRTPPGRHFSPPLRHEAASALYAWRQWLAKAPGWTALAVYLIAVHHGKVRTVLRSRSRKEPGGNDVFGIEQGDTLSVPCRVEPPCELDLAPRLFGASGEWADGRFHLDAPGWVEVVAELLDPSIGTGLLAEDEPKGLGPFRLAMLEACVAAADVRASREEEGRA
jgi:CRISPR-associated endonuclease/helicase Cas3